MKSQEDKELHQLLTDTMMEKAPQGMVQRIMNRLALEPVRRLSVQPVKSKPIAALMPIIMLVILGVASVIKPQSWFTIPSIHLFELNINPIWIAPVVIFALAFWAGILLLRKYSDSETSH